MPLSIYGGVVHVSVTFAITKTLRRPHEHLIRLVIRLLLIPIADIYLPDVAAVVAVVEQANVEPRLQGGEEFVQSATPLRELKREESFIVGVRPTAHEIADVGLGELVPAQVACRHAVLFEALYEVFDVNSVTFMGLTAATSLANAPGLSGMDTAKIASFFSPIAARSAMKRKRSKFMLAPLATATSCLLVSSDGLRSTYFFRPARDNAPAGSKIDRVSSKTSLIAAQISADPERLLTYSLHSRSVREETDIVQRHPLARLQRCHQRIRIESLNADDLDMRRYPLHDLSTDRSLAGNDIRVVKRRDVGEAMHGRKTTAFRLGRIEVAPVQDNISAHPRDVHMLDRRRAGRHSDGGRDTEFSGGESYALCVVASRAGDDAFPAFGFAEMRHLVEDIAFQSVAETLAVNISRRYYRHYKFVLFRRGLPGGCELHYEVLTYVWGPPSSHHRWWCSVEVETATLFCHAAPSGVMIPAAILTLQKRSGRKRHHDIAEMNGGDDAMSIPGNINTAPPPSSFDDDSEFYEESRWAKLQRRIKEEPLIPLGCALTCWALIEAADSLDTAPAQSGRATSIVRTACSDVVSTRKASLSSLWSSGLRIGSLTARSGELEAREEEEVHLRKIRDNIIQQKVEEKRTASRMSEGEAREVEDKARDSVAQNKGGWGSIRSAVEESERRGPIVEAVSKLWQSRRAFIAVSAPPLLSGKQTSLFRRSSQRLRYRLKISYSDVAIAILEVISLHAKASSAVNFFALPREIRDWIYDLSLQDTALVHRGRRSHTNLASNKWEISYQRAPVLSLLLVSRQWTTEYLKQAADRITCGARESSSTACTVTLISCCQTLNEAVSALPSLSSWEEILMADIRSASLINDMEAEHLAPRAHLESYFYLREPVKETLPHRPPAGLPGYPAKERESRAVVDVFVREVSDCGVDDDGKWSLADDVRASSDESTKADDEDKEYEDEDEEDDEEEFEDDDGEEVEDDDDDDEDERLYGCDHGDNTANKSPTCDFDGTGESNRKRSTHPRMTSCIAVSSIFYHQLTQDRHSLKCTHHPMRSPSSPLLVVTISRIRVRLRVGSAKRSPRQLRLGVLGERRLRRARLATFANLPHPVPLCLSSLLLQPFRPERPGVSCLAFPSPASPAWARSNDTDLRPYPSPVLQPSCSLCLRFCAHIPQRGAHRSGQVQGTQTLRIERLSRRRGG
ncbi:Threonine dehydratase [Hortaea werneckii]|nr:Threonine dehydratase [Hortaea werneckii]